MLYLHSHNIIHRDLKPANILEDGINKNEFYDYIDMIDNYSIEFDLTKKFNKITISNFKVKIDETENTTTTSNQPEPNSEPETKLEEQREQNGEEEHKSKFVEELKKSQEFNKLPEEIKKMIEEQTKTREVEGEENNYIKIEYKYVYLLYKNELLNSPGLITVLSNFYDVIIELEYPSEHFDSIQSIIL